MIDLKDKDSKALAAMVVVYRHLHLEKEQAIACMEELVKRKANGDDFDYEGYISDNLKEMPSSQMGSKEKNMIMNILKNEIKIK